MENGIANGASIVRQSAIPRPTYGASNNVKDNVNGLFTSLIDDDFEVKVVVPAYVVGQMVYLCQVPLQP